MKSWNYIVIALMSTVPLSSANCNQIPGKLISGDYHITQSWSQETQYARPYYVRVPERQNNVQRLPVLIFLHGNGGNAREAMRGFVRGRGQIAARYILVFPQGYRESWNIVSERSKADDLRFIESIVSSLARFTNVDRNGFTVMGASNGAAMVNQLAIESRLPNIRNYISGVSQLNVWQHDGTHFKVKGAKNQYGNITEPARGKRLLNISGLKDNLVPYRGGPSRVIPAKNGKLVFLGAEKSTYLWAQHMGYEGEQLIEPTKVIENVEVFSYLGGDVVHCKVVNEGHGATHGIGERLILNFLNNTSGDITNAKMQGNVLSPADSQSEQSTPGGLDIDRYASEEEREEINGLQERMEVTLRDQLRLQSLMAVTDEKIKILQEANAHRKSVQQAEDRLELAVGEQQIQQLEGEIERAEVQCEVCNLRLDIIDRRLEVVNMKYSLPEKASMVQADADQLLQMLDSINEVIAEFSGALDEGKEEALGDLEREFVEFEEFFERQREVLQLKFELLEAREKDDFEWIEELEAELQERQSER